VSEWHRLGIMGLRLSYLHSQTNPVELTGHMLDRIDRLNPRINLFSQLDRDRSLHSAHESAAEFLGDHHRPLEGVPIAVSSDLAIAGLDHIAGLEARRGITALHDAAIIAKLRQAGAIILGSLNMDEAGLGLECNNASFGCTYNPHGEDRSPGGAAGGAGAAVAAGFAVAALGGDTLAGMRLPAALCGVFSLRPSAGYFDLTGLAPVSPTLDNIAISTRSLDDMNAVLTAIAPPDLTRAMSACQFAILDRMDDNAIEPDVRAHFDYAVSLLAEPPGLLSVPASLPRIRLAARNYAERDLAGSLASLGEDRCNLLSDKVLGRITAALSIRELDLQDDLEVLRQSGRALRGQVGPTTILLTPAAPDKARCFGAPVNAALTDFLHLADIAGLPSLVIPAGRAGDNLPIGLQLIGPQGSEAMLITQGRMLSDRLRGYAPPQSWW